MVGDYQRRLAYNCAFFGMIILSCVLAMPLTSNAAEDAGSASSTVQGCRPLSDARNERYIFVDYVSVQATCIAQIAAIIDTSEKICPPDTFTNIQAQRVVVSYIDQKPARLHERFTKVALEALVSAWPCPH